MINSITPRLLHDLFSCELRGDPLVNCGLIVFHDTITTIQLLISFSSVTPVTFENKQQQQLL